MSGLIKKQSLIIFAKPPEPEIVKTRLKGFLTDEERLKLYIRLTENTINLSNNLPKTDVYIFYAPEGSPDFFKKYNLPLMAQSGPDLGHRMYNALKVIFSKGYERAVIIGVDIPELNSEHIMKAFKMLDTHDIVFGPATDGGYYLVGVKEPVKEIFSHIPWSTDKVLSMSIKRAKKAGYTVAMIDELRDIDRIEDLRYYKISLFHPSTS